MMQQQYAYFYFDIEIEVFFNNSHRKLLTATIWSDRVISQEKYLKDWK